MTTIDSFIQRNRAIAAQRMNAGTLPSPTLQNALNRLPALIIGCADMRVDPVHILGVQPSEAVILRNIGGRVTPSLMEEMGLLNRVAEVAEGYPGQEAPFHLIVLHHTDCGMTRLVNDPELLSHYFGIPQEALPNKHVSDPRASVATDVAVLRSEPTLPATWFISGLVYDVATGLVETVVPPAHLREEAD